jgi:hypothetical protein
MKTVSVQCTWESLHDVQVPDDWTTDQPLPPSAFNEMKSHTASLVDWIVDDRSWN